MTDSIDWTDTTPLRLKIAAERAFPSGGMTASGLRKEAARGRLVVERIAGRDYTTMQAIADMRKLCRVSKPQPRAAGHGGESPEVAQGDALARMSARLNSLKNIRRK